MSDKMKCPFCDSEIDVDVVLNKINNTNNSDYEYKLNLWMLMNIAKSFIDGNREQDALRVIYSILNNMIIREYISKIKTQNVLDEYSNLIISKKEEQNDVK